MDWRTLFLSADGRIGVKDFWIGALVLVVAGMLALPLHIFAPVVWLLLMFGWVCVIAKRLHDFGKSGWLMLLPLALAMIAGLLALIFGGLSIAGAIWTGVTGGYEPSSWAV